MNAKRKDNYSWLDDCLDTALEEYTLEVVDPIAADGVEEMTVIRNKAKQTIISQIEIEKLRARRNELKQFKVPEQWKEFIKLSGNEACTICGFNSETARKFVDDRISDLTEKLKELEREL